MGLAALRSGQRIRLDGVYFDLAGLLPSHNWQLIEVNTGERDEKPADALWSAFLQHRLKFVLPIESRAAANDLMNHLTDAAAASQHAYPTEEIQAAEQRWKFVQAFNKLKGLLPIREACEEAAKQVDWGVAEPPRLRAAQYWAAKVRNASDPLFVLIVKHNHQGNRSDRYPTEVIDLTDGTIKDKYLKRTPRLSVQAVTREVARVVRKENRLRLPSDQLPEPGRRFVESRIQLIPERERIAARYGSDIAMMKFRTSLGGVKTTHVLERAEIDHTRLAIVLLDDDFVPWGRASCSICLDAHSRVPTGVYYGPEVPSIVSVARCINCSVLPKTDLLKAFQEVKGQWDCFGVHETYVVDNGLEEHAAALRHAASELGGSTVEFCPRKAAWFKPHVERHFRNQDLSLLQTLPGCTGENIATRPDFDPKKDILVTRRTFDKIFMIWLVNIYLREPQAALGNISPIAMWNRSITPEDQPVPTRRVLLERLFMHKEAGRSLDHEGIQYDLLIYNSTDMGALRAQLGARLTVDIWVSDEDLGYIFVDVPGRDISIRVPCLDQAYAAGLTRWQHKKCKAMRRVGMDDGLQLTLDDAREQIDTLIASDRAEIKHAHRTKRSRFQEQTTPMQRAQGTLDPQPAPTTTNQPPSIANEALLRSTDRRIPVLACAVASRGSP